MTKQISQHAAAAKMIRKELKDRGIKATVRASTASMTSSVDVTIKQDLHPDAIAEVKQFVEQFQYGNFNGMEDIYEYSNRRDDLPQVKYTFVRVEYSEEIKSAVARYIGEINGIGEYEQDRYCYMALAGTWGDFWDEYLGLTEPVAEVRFFGEDLVA
jgi:hypothetical protein